MLVLFAGLSWACTAWVIRTDLQIDVRCWPARGGGTKVPMSRLSRLFAILLPAAMASFFTAELLGVNPQFPCIVLILALMISKALKLVDCVLAMHPGVALASR